MFLEMTVLRTSDQQTLPHSEVTKLKAQALTRTLNTVALRSANYHRVSERTLTNIGTTTSNNALQRLCAVVAQSDDLGPVVEMWLDFYPKHHQCLTPVSGLADDSTLFEVKKADRLPWYVHDRGQ